MAKRYLHFAVLLFQVVLPAAVLAQPYVDEPAGQQVGIPVYDPDSKRYFALMHWDGHYGTNVWEKTAEAASSQVYKDVRGRLAIVDSLEVHEFLLKTFRPGRYQFIWIGLRYLCNAKKLEWSNGKLWQPGSFQIWDANWKQDIYACSNPGDPNDYAPVAYSAEMHSWIAKGLHKGYDWYFVEFPTGHP